LTRKEPYVRFLSSAQFSALTGATTVTTPAASPQSDAAALVLSLRALLGAHADADLDVARRCAAGAMRTALERLDWADRYVAFCVDAEKLAWLRAKCASEVRPAIRRALASPYNTSAIRYQLAGKFGASTVAPC
jgi:hypothetical protein